MDHRLQKYISKILIMIVLLLSGVAGIAQQSKTYDEAIIMGDKFFSDHNFLDAKAYYQKALSFKKQDEYANAQISKIIVEMSSQMEREERYIVIIDRADELFDKNKFDDALVEYAKALAVISDDDYAQNKIVKINDIQTNQKEKLETFNALIFEGKKYLEENKHSEAIINFKNAHKVFPDNKEPETLILEAKNLKAEYDAKLEIYNEEVELANRYISIKNYAEAIEHLNKAIVIFPDNWAVENEIKKYQPLAEKQQEYNIKVEKADELYINKNYASAKEMYLQASDLWSENSYTTDMVDRIDERLNLQMADLDVNYDKSIKSADSLFNSDELISARTEYNFSLSLKPNEAYPKTKLNEIEAVFERQRQEIEVDYQAIVRSGDSLLALNNYSDSKVKYELALSVRPEDTYPTSKLKEIDGILLGLAAQSELEKQYTSIIAEADALVNSKSYDEAIVKYQEAISIKAGDNYPLARIAEIENVIANAARQNEIDKDYAEQMEIAKNLFNEDKLADARTTFVKASELKPLEQEPKTEIAKIDGIFEQREHQLVLDSQYQTYLRKGDSLSGLKQFDESILAFQQALALKPNNSFANDQLTAVQDQKAEYEESLATQEVYDSSIVKGDELFTQNNYSESKKEYEKARGLKPQEEYPITKIQEIEVLLVAIAAQNTLDLQYATLIGEADGLYSSTQYENAILKYRKASSLKPKEEYPQSKIAATEILIANVAKQKEIDDEYSKQMDMAERLFNDNYLAEAKNTYLAAKEIKPLEEQPKLEIAKIDSIIDYEANQLRIETEYQAYIDQGDSLIGIKLFDESIVEYNAALALKAGDAFANNKISSAQTDKVEYDKAIASLQAYEYAIKEADDLFADKKYSESILAYEKASGIKANKTYPKNKVNEINAILARLAAENTRKYNEAIVKADNHFDASNLSEAVIQYKIASSFKPTENYPKERIAESNSLIEEKLRLVRNEYNLAIAEADKLYATKIYDKAIVAYQKADQIFPEEDYPEERIAKILKLIEENAITDVINQKITINSGTTETLNFEPVRINVRKSNYIFVKATNLSGNSFKIIFGYGSDKGKNGGFMVQVPEGNEQNDYIIRVGNQYKWFSEDNNWISVSPENGDIEISLLRISKSD